MSETLCGERSSAALPSCKVVVVGDSGVGKTALIKRYFHNVFERRTDVTIGANFVEKEVTLDDGETVLLQVCQKKIFRSSFHNDSDVGYGGARAVPTSNANVLPWRTLRCFRLQRYERGVLFGHGGLDLGLSGENAVSQLKPSCKTLWSCRHQWHS